VAATRYRDRMIPRRLRPYLIAAALIATALIAVVAWSARTRTAPA
jgi:hypothetical protein